MITALSGIANFFVMIKERGVKVAVVIAGVTLVLALVVGGGLNRLLTLLGISP